VRLHGINRVLPVRRMTDEYSKVRRAEYLSALFRRQRIANVLDDKPWWWGFARLCATTPDEMTIKHNAFCRDARIAVKETEMTDAAHEEDMTLEHLIYKRVQSYVLGKTERKYSLSWSQVKNTPGQQEEYDDKKKKVAREAFLAVRSRTGADFVAYFTSTICSVPHGVPESKYLEIARALMDPKEVEKVRSLTLLALSAVA